MASISGDDPQRRTSSILGLCREAPRTEDQAKNLALKPTKIDRNSEKSDIRRARMATSGRMPTKHINRLVFQRGEVKWDMHLNKDNDKQKAENPRKSKFGTKTLLNRRPAGPGHRGGCSWGQLMWVPGPSGEAHPRLRRTATPKHPKNPTKTDVRSIGSVPKRGGHLPKI